MAWIYISQNQRKPDSFICEVFIALFTQVKERSTIVHDKTFLLYLYSVRQLAASQYYILQCLFKLDIHNSKKIWSNF